jgi:hypothetical protein
MPSNAAPVFDPKAFLTRIENGKTKREYRNKQVVSSQGDPADAVFCIVTGRAKLTVVSTRGKEAVIGVLKGGSFFGEGCLAGQPLRMSIAIAVQPSSIIRVGQSAMGACSIESLSSRSSSSPTWCRATYASKMTWWTMPGVTGFEVLKKLRHSTRTVQIPAVVVSGNIIEGKEAQVAELGTVAFLRKPVNPHPSRDAVARRRPDRLRPRSCQNASGASGGRAPDHTGDMPA